MATLDLGSNWRIHSDTHCWVLQQTRIDKEGDVVPYNSTYHGSPAAAVRAYVRDRLRTSQAFGVLEILQVLDDIVDGLRLHLGPALEIDNDAMLAMMRKAEAAENNLDGTTTLQGDQ